MLIYSDLHYFFKYIIQLRQNKKNPRMGMAVLRFSPVENYGTI